MRDFEKNLNIDDNDDSDHRDVQDKDDENEDEDMITTMKLIQMGDC